MGGDFATDIITGRQGADSVLLCKNAISLCVFYAYAEEHIPRQVPFPVFMQDAGRVGCADAHLLGGNEKLEYILPVIFWRIYIF